MAGIMTSGYQYHIHIPIFCPREIRAISNSRYEYLGITVGAPATRYSPPKHACVMFWGAVPLRPNGIDGSTYRKADFGLGVLLLLPILPQGIQPSLLLR